MSTTHAIEGGSSGPSRWLRARRVRIAFTVAAIEALLVAIFHDVSRWTVIVLAAVTVVLYWYAGRHSRSDSFRQVTWILAVSQLAALLAAIFAFIVVGAVIALIVIFALVALFYVFTDRR